LEITDLECNEDLKSKVRDINYTYWLL
jgi:hypothetical protein